MVFTIFNIPSELDTICDSCFTDAVPPTWNVLIVNWVPGSPIDWAEIIPIASPTWTILPLDKSLPYEVAQTPSFALHVITEYTFILFTPAASIFSHPASSIISFFFIKMSPVSGFFTSFAATLPRALSDKLTIMFPPSKTSVSLIDPHFISHLGFVIVKSWATSHNLRVKYPELAVFKAVSAKPFLAPCVELKYSRAVRPSLKFEVIGDSIISPDGFAIKPLIPANCFIWAADPLAPLSAIINTEFILRPSSVTSVAEILFIISDATLSVHFDHASITLLYFSPLVINPSAYWFS